MLSPKVKCLGLDQPDEVLLRQREKYGTSTKMATHWTLLHALVVVPLAISRIVSNVVLDESVEEGKE